MYAYGINSTWLVGHGTTMLRVRILKKSILLVLVVVVQPLEVDRLIQLFHAKKVSALCK